MTVRFISKDISSPSKGSQATEDMVYSFDVFDTLITRTVATPRGIFEAMVPRLRTWQVLSATLTAENFPAERIAAEQRARRAVSRREGREETTLEAIYRELQASTGLDDATAASLKELEIQFELEHVAPVPRVVAEVLERIEAGHRIVLISDMYLPSCVIARMVHAVEPRIAASATLYVSSEIGTTKHSGRLFRHVLHAEGISARQLAHTGDNRRSDHVVPRLIGIRTRHFTETRPMPWERFGRDEASLAWQCFTGASRSYRLRCANPHRLLGFALAGPILTAFVDWVLSEARRRGIDRLYFVARDGQTPHLIARRLLEQSGAAMPQVGYLYGSRQAWNLPSVASIGARELDWIFLTYQQITLAKLANRTALPPDWFIRQLGDRLPRTLDWHEPLTPDLVEICKTAFREDDAIRRRVSDNAQKQRDRLMDYLQGERFFESDRCGLVDIGWLGNVQDSLHLALTHAGRSPKLQGFYFGLLTRTPLTSEQNDKTGYCVTPETDVRQKTRVTRIAPFIELFASADHGSVVGYERRGDHVAPVLDQQDQGVMAWGFAEFRQGILDFAESYAAVGASSADIVARRRDAPPMDASTIHSFTSHFVSDLALHLRRRVPDAVIAECLGSYPFTPDQDATQLSQLGPCLTTGRAVRYLLSNSTARRALSMWSEGSAARSGPLVRLLLHPRTQAVANALLLRDFNTIADLLPTRMLETLLKAMPKWLIRVLERIHYGHTVTPRDSDDRGTPAQLASRKSE